MPLWIFYNVIEMSIKWFAQNATFIEHRLLHMVHAEIMTWKHSFTSKNKLSVRYVQLSAH